MTYLDAFILGLLQGLTEFLPVSSSGHLVIMGSILGVQKPGGVFEIILHLGSLLAVFIFFRKKIFVLIQAVFNSSMKKERMMIGFIGIATIPAVIAVLFFKDFFEQSFTNPLLASSMLFITGFILLATRIRRGGTKEITLKSSILIGIGQAFAILPGISRSGTTISIGMLLGLKPSETAEFSFLLVIPAILGAVVLKFGELSQIDSALIGQYSFGLLVTFVSSMFAVYAVLELIKKGKFEYFAYYCFAAGTFGLYLFV